MPFVDLAVSWDPILLITSAATFELTLAHLFSLFPLGDIHRFIQPVWTTSCVLGPTVHIQVMAEDETEKSMAIEADVLEAPSTFCTQ